MLRLQGQKHYPRGCAAGRCPAFGPGTPINGGISSRCTSRGHTDSHKFNNCLSIKYHFHIFTEIIIFIIDFRYKEFPI